MAICSKRVLRDVDDGDAAEGSSQLLAELIRIDLKSKAEGRQIRNIDLTKRVQQSSALTIDEQISAAEKSVQATTKNKLYGCLSKTLVNVAKAVKSGRKNSDKLVEVTLNAVQSLDSETLLKAG